MHSHPKSHSERHAHFNNIVSQETKVFCDLLAASESLPIDIKDLVLKTCGNVFLNYFCSKRFDMDHEGFVELVDTFDSIFFEVNAGYAIDFFPKLAPFYQKMFQRMSRWSGYVRKFVVNEVVEGQLNYSEDMEEEKNYLQTMINHVKTNAEPKMCWKTCLYALEDVIGGHSAVGNFFTKVLGFVATRPDVQKAAQEEIDRANISEPLVDLTNCSLPYIMAIIFETIRMLVSPIVPHVANQDTTIAGNFIVYMFFCAGSWRKLWMF